MNLMNNLTEELDRLCSQYKTRMRTGYKTRTRHKMWTRNYALKLDSADTVMILTSRMMMWFLFSQHVPHITDV